MSDAASIDIERWRPRGFWKGSFNVNTTRGIFVNIRCRIRQRGG